MAFPSSVRSILYEVGQVAAEVPCPIEGFKEYISLYMSKTESIMNAESRFWYLPKNNYIYKICRFRIRSELIETDARVSQDDLFDYQQIYLTNEETAEYILLIWIKDLNILNRPDICSIPV